MVIVCVLIEVDSRFIPPGPNGLPRECRICHQLNSPLLPLGVFSVQASPEEKDPPNYGYCLGTMVTRQGCYLCGECFGTARVQNYDQLELAYHQTFLKHRRQRDLSRAVVQRMLLYGVRLPKISGNTPEWMRARFGPDLKRVGASACATILSLDSYADPTAFYQKLTPELTQQLLQSLHNQSIPHGIVSFEQCGVMYAPERSEGSQKTDPTEFGHAYEDFVGNLLKLLMPGTHIVDGGICVPQNEADRKRYAVSVDGLVYVKDEMSDVDDTAGLLGGFEAKCAWHRDHADQARDSARYSSKNPNASDGVKAEHMAQTQMQMWVVGLLLTFYLTVKWCKWIPPHPKLGIPPFEVEYKKGPDGEEVPIPKVNLVKIHRDTDYWEGWALPKMHAFTDAIRTHAPLPPSKHTRPPPRVRVDNVLQPGSPSHTLLLGLIGPLEEWKQMHSPACDILGVEILAQRAQQRANGQKVDYSRWWWKPSSAPSEK